MVPGMSMAARVRWKISMASCLRSGMNVGFSLGAAAIWLCLLDCARSRLRNVGVLVLGAVAYADGADADAVGFEGQAAANGGLPAAAGDRETEREQQVRLRAVH